MNIQIRDIPHLAKNERDARISCTLRWTGPRVRAFFKESRMKIAEPTELHRKSEMWATRRFVTGRNPRLSSCGLAVFGCEFVCVVVHFAGLRRARQEQNSIGEGYVLVFVDGVVQGRRLGIKDVLPQGIGSE